mmetsp:Transcript_20797/g.37326  ORF Transcript_20797/g.37326 Transcript_20797/m.37326 type:complete len:94 (-) Transcript_20797:28-309(-)
MFPNGSDDDSLVKEWETEMDTIGLDWMISIFGTEGSVEVNILSVLNFVCVKVNVSPRFSPFGIFIVLFTPFTTQLTVADPSDGCDTVRGTFTS